MPLAPLDRALAAAPRTGGPQQVVSELVELAERMFVKTNRAGNTDSPDPEPPPAP